MLGLPRVWHRPAASFVGSGGTWACHSLWRRAEISPTGVGSHLLDAAHAQRRHRVGGLTTMAIPDSDIDPFTAEFFEGPHPAQETLRELGPVVRLTRYGVFAVARTP